MCLLLLWFFFFYCFRIPSDNVGREPFKYIYRGVGRKSRNPSGFYLRPNKKKIPGFSSVPAFQNSRRLYFFYFLKYRKCMENIYFLPLRERNDSTAASLCDRLWPLLKKKKKKKKNLMPHLLFQEFLMSNREFFLFGLKAKFYNHYKFEL